ncbi:MULTISPECIES: helix-turn-helix transcriptional regulator [unclassified Streptomyces]|uniref:helix-turn-helix domain-containing protein n=1 Tax=unclassified Streptomyces TaxID=2593676 RepID=UPI002ED0DEFB|nr:helix-turn-helix domain-containing protein [Streptomyces sp. NBC_00891]WSY07482.1 helix-turn-helix domain-containing protein [Streptomyces sp. NBC_00890]WSZ09107.1 helix-turn-helix domain-containing protein [Streptomyces sp. NBC_00869]WSZ23394.1 helix-turn-helix domain-containing protein [Streptomyces sp. NBC_00870]
MKGRSWSEVRAEAMSRHPELATAEAEERRAVIREENEARVRGHELAVLRRKAGLTQRDMAARLKVSQARVSQIEHGRIDSLEMLRAYASVLGGRITVCLALDETSVRVA